jgi:hypothetical protein
MSLVVAHIPSRWDGCGGPLSADKLCHEAAVGGSYSFPVGTAAQRPAGRDACSRAAQRTTTRRGLDTDISSACHALSGAHRVA